MNDSIVIEFVEDTPEHCIASIKYNLQKIPLSIVEQALRDAAEEVNKMNTTLEYDHARRN